MKCALSRRSVYTRFKVSLALRNRAQARVEGVRGVKTQQQIDRKRRTNRMLIAMVSIFVCCWAPLNVIHLTLEYRDDLQNSSYFLFVFFVAHLIAMSSTVYNPFLYAWMTDNFRKEFYKVMPCLFPAGVRSVVNNGSPSKYTTVQIDGDQIQLSSLPPRPTSTLQHSDGARSTSDGGRAPPASSIGLFQMTTAAIFNAETCCGGGANDNDLLPDVTTVTSGFDRQPCDEDDDDEEEEEAVSAASHVAVEGDRDANSFSGGDGQDFVAGAASTSSQYVHPPSAVLLMFDSLDDEVDRVSTKTPAIDELRWMPEVITTTTTVMAAAAAATTVFSDESELRSSNGGRSPVVSDVNGGIDFGAAAAAAAAYPTTTALK